MMKKLVFVSIFAACISAITSCALVTVPVKVAGKVVTTSVDVVGKVAGAGVDVVTPNKSEPVAD